MTAIKERPDRAVSVVDAFGQAVARHGDAAAVRADGREISYRDLWNRAGEIACVIHGAGQIDPPHVALLLNQGIDGVAAILGILRAGMAYVALDPAEPPERLRFVCRDADAGIVLTSESHAELAGSIAADGAAVIDIEQFPAGSSAALTPEISGSDRAVIVYTSGSTGQPKGVTHTHRNELWFGGAFADRMDLRAGDRLTLLSSLSFGAANTDICAAILRGATLCLYDTRRHGVEGLPEWVDAEQITVLHTVPTVFRYLAEHAPPQGYGSVRAIDLAGEPVYRSDVRRSREAFPSRSILVNRYSATETVVIAQHVAGPADENGDGVLPAGVSPTGVEVLLLDEVGQEVDTGEIGEIVVRSEFISPGYWRRPELTAAAFSDDPAVPGLRRYRTGDAGSVGADGTLTVLGRLDKRVKIRGLSVEPAEVEAALRSMPGVRDAIVDVERLGTGADAVATLVGYIVAADGAGAAPLDPQSVRGALADRVPLHMLPARMRVVDAFPLTRTGKVDRLALRALPAEAPVAMGPGVAPPAEPPSGAVERRVAQIFERILGVPVASRKDDFFMLGGTSLTLAQLQTDLRRELGGELELADVVRSASVERVASAIARQPETARGRSTTNAASALVVSLRPEGVAAPLFLIHGWHGQAYVTPGFLDAVPDDHPVFSIGARGLRDGRRPLRSVRAMAAEYLEAIKEVKGTQRPVLVGICAGGVIAIEMARQAQAAGSDHFPVIMLDPPYPPYARPLPVRMRDLTAFYLGLYTPSFGPAKQVSRHIMRRLRSRAERIGTPELDSATLQSATAVRVALSVGIALRRHRPQVYDGPIRVIASARRVSDSTWRSDVWRRVLTGPIELISAGESHLDTLNPANVAFRAALRRAIDAIDEKQGPLTRNGSSKRRPSSRKSRLAGAPE
jgi:amino acid adenylation domain-containing protein